MDLELLEAFNFACESRRKATGAARDMVNGFIDKVLDARPGESMPEGDPPARVGP